MADYSWQKTVKSAARDIKPRLLVTRTRPQHFPLHRGSSHAPLQLISTPTRLLAIMINLHKAHRATVFYAAFLFLSAVSADARDAPKLVRSLLSGDDATVAYEWSGVFSVTGNSHTWIMQKKDNKYADPSMKLVIIPVASPTLSNADGLMTAKSDAGNDLMEDSCTEKSNGDKLTPAADGTCFNLNVNDSLSEVSFTINTADLTGLAFFAEHEPTEFEDTKHFFQDSAEEDIECLAQTVAESGHDHGHGEETIKPTCACASRTHRFEIDCTDKPTMQAAIDYLSANGICSSCEPTDECKKQFLILQTHHDYCHHTEIPDTAEHEIHDFEGNYDGCSISRRYVDTAKDCPALGYTCATAATKLPTLAQLTTADCAATKCKSELCITYFQQILLAHDTCDHDEIKQFHETALHDLEEVCDAAGHWCNTAPESTIRLDTSLCVTSGATSKFAAALGLCAAGSFIAAV